MIKWLAPLILIAPFIIGFWQVTPHLANYVLYAISIFSIYWIGVLIGLIFEKGLLKFDKNGDIEL